jgi:hypothetical protein
MILRRLNGFISVQMMDEHNGMNSFPEFLKRRSRRIQKH